MGKIIVSILLTAQMIGMIGALVDINLKDIISSTNENPAQPKPTMGNVKQLMSKTDEDEKLMPWLKDNSAGFELLTQFLQYIILDYSTLSVGKFKFGLVTVPFALLCDIPEIKPFICFACALDCLGAHNTGGGECSKIKNKNEFTCLCTKGNPDDKDKFDLILSAAKTCGINAPEKYIILVGELLYEFFEFRKKTLLCLGKFNIGCNTDAVKNHGGILGDCVEEKLIAEHGEKIVCRIKYPTTNIIAA